MELTAEIPGMEILDRAWQQCPELVVTEMTAAMWQSELLLQREVQELTPVGVSGAGGLKGSIFTASPEISSNAVIGVVGSPLSYAESVELGTKPHWAPIEPLLDWVIHKLGKTEAEAERVARSIQLNIAHHGTPAAGMFHRGLNQTRAQIEQFFEQAVGRIAIGLTGGLT